MSWRGVRGGGPNGGVSGRTIRAPSLIIEMPCVGSTSPVREWLLVTGPVGSSSVRLVSFEGVKKMRTVQTWETEVKPWLTLGLGGGNSLVCSNSTPGSICCSMLEGGRLGGRPTGLGNGERSKDDNTVRAGDPYSK